MGWFDKFLPRRDQIQPAATMQPVEVRIEPRRARQPESNLPRFKSSATEQLSGGVGAAERARLKLRDAFTPSQPVSNPAMLAGRADLLQSLIRSIEEQRMHVVLFGDRGIGKTSLLHVLTRLATEARYIVHYASCGEESTFDQIFRVAAGDVPLLYHQDHPPTDAETEKGRSLASLLPEEPIVPRQVSDLFARMTGTRLLIILDEFDRSPPGQFRRQVAELIKNLSDRSVRVQLVIAGVAANLTELIELIPSIRRNIVGLPVGTLTRDEIAEMVRNGQRASGYSFDPPAVEMIVSLSAGSPYLAGLLGQHAGLLAVDRGAESVEAEDVAGAIGRAVAEIGDRVSETARFAIDRANDAGDGEALPKLAHAAIRGGGRFGDEALAETMPDADARTQTLQRLHASSGLIEPIENDPAGRYRFREEGVPIYLWMRFARDDIRNG